MDEHLDEALLAQLRTESGLCDYVEEHLRVALAGSLPQWSVLAEPGSRVPGVGGKWAWHRSQHEPAGGSPWHWQIHAASGSGGPHQYYEVLASSAAELIYVTHGNQLRGLWSSSFLVRRASVVTFESLALRLPIAPALSDVIRSTIECEPPNCEHVT